MHLAWNDWHEPLANTPDSMLPLPFTFNVSDVGLKPYAATPAPEKLLSELLQLGNFSGTGALLCDLGALCAFAAAALTPISCKLDFN